MGISPDGRNIYVAHGDTSGISQCDRKSNGALSNRVKTNIGGWNSGMDVSVSPDGGNVYAVARSSNSIHYWQRIKYCLPVADATCIACASDLVCTALTCTTNGKFDVDGDATNGCEASVCPNTDGKHVPSIFYYLIISF